MHSMPVRDKREIPRGGKVILNENNDVFFCPIFDVI